MAGSDRDLDLNPHVDPVQKAEITVTERLRECERRIALLQDEVYELRDRVMMSGITIGGR